MCGDSTLCVLLWKHLKERRHRKCHTFWEIFSGFLVFFALFLWRQLLLMEEKLSDSELDINVVMYSPVTPAVNRLMSHVVANLNLEQQRNSPVVQLLGYPSEEEIIHGLSTSQDDSKVVAVLNFHNFSTYPSTLNFTVSLVSNVQLLHTNWLSLFFDNNPRATRSNNASITHLKWAVDKSFLEDRFQEHIRPEVALFALSRIFPGGLDKVYDFLILCSGLAPLPFFLCNAVRLVVERRTGLKELMKLDGVSPTTLRFSHLLDTTIMGAFYATLITLLLKATSNPILPKSCPFVVGFTIMLHFLSITSLAFITSTISQDQQHADSFALLIYMLSLLLASQYYNHTKQAPPVIYIVSLILPHHPIYVFWHEVMHFEKRGVGMTFENLAEAATTMPALVIWLMLILNIAVTMILAWYLDLVRPGRWGVAEKWDFMCSKRFWRRHRKRVTFHVTVEKIVHVLRDDRFFEKGGPKRKYRDIAIKICEVTKIFNQHTRSEVKALDHVSLEVYKGEITVLLGGNGAGKTTLMCVVTGMYSSGCGKVYVNGYDASMRLQEVRRDLSLCPQHNLTFDYLTVKENVTFFARLSIQPKGSFYLTVEYLIASLRLASRVHKYSYQLSAGMKRCLQVACALASGADVLVMDEPSTGMDVETRRALWKLLLSLRGKKTVFLSTALMEEAEVLGDRIALLDSGHVRCHGSPNFLKRAIGAGLNVTMTLLRDEKLEEIEGFMKEKIPGTTMTRYNEVKKKVTFKLPLEHEALFPDMFKELELRQEELGIESMEVGMAMEEIFLSFIENDEVSLATATSDYEECVCNERSRLKGCGLLYQRFKVLMVRYICFLINNKNMFIVLQVLLPIIGIPYLTYMSNFSDDPTTRLAEDLSGRLDTRRPVRPSVVYDFKPRDNYQRTLSDEDWKEKFDYEFVESTNVRHDMDRLAKGTARRSVVGIRMQETNEIHYPVDDIPAALDGISLFSNLYTYFKNPLEGRRVVADYKQLRLFPLSAFVEPKTEMQCMAWNAWMFFFINLALAPFIIISVHEYRSGIRYVLCLGGCPPMLHWVVKFVVQLALFVVIIPTSIVLSAVFLDEDDVLNDSEYLVSIVVLILLFAVAYLSFTCVLSFFLEEDNALAQVYMMTLCLGVVTPVFLLLLGTLVEHLSFLKVPFYIIMVMAYVVTPHYCFTKGLNVLTEAALHNRICMLNQALCPELSKKYELCCQSNVTTPYPYLDSSGGELAVSILAVQFILYNVLLYLMTHRVIQALYGKFTNLTYVPKLQYHYSQDVKDQKTYAKETIKALKGMAPGVVPSDDCLVVSNLHKKYVAHCYGKSRYAVRGVNFAVKKGECVCIVGGNGAGKTTTLNTIIGYTPKTRGEMWCNGYFLGANRLQYIHSMGYMSDTGGMDDFLSAIEVVQMRGLLSGHPPAEAEHLALAALRYMGLDKYNQLVRNFSPGCRRRLGIAALLVTSPHCVLLDEPSESVDAAARPLIVRALSGLLRRGVSALVAAHSIDWKDLEMIGTNIFVMCKGELALYGTPVQLKTNYACGLTARLKLHMEPVTTQFKSTADKVETTISRYSRVFELKMSFQDIFEGAILVSEQISVIYYLITSDSNRLIFNELFTKLHDLKEAFEDILQDYTLSETSIDELYAMLERFHE